MVSAVLSDPLSPGAFSGLAAIIEAVVVTPSESVLRGRLSALRQAHNVYVCILVWNADAPASDRQVSLTLPFSNVHGKQSVTLSRAQFRKLEAAFSPIDIRPECSRTAGHPFQGATYYTLRVTLQTRNKSRCRAVAKEKLKLPIFKHRADAGRVHYWKIYGL